MISDAIGRARCDDDQVRVVGSGAVCSGADVLLLDREREGGGEVRPAEPRGVAGAPGAAAAQDGPQHGQTH